APLGRRASARAHYSVLDYDRLGRTAAAHLADRLVRRSGAAAAPGASGAAPSPFSLAVRRLLGLTLDVAIGRVVARTRAAFGVDRATVSMLETSDPDASHLRRSEEDPQGPLTVAAAQAGGLAVTDLRADPRFRDSPLACRHGMRFYAGHPIYASTGEPTAVLAIFDPRPRTFSPQEMSVLRNHALLIQHLLTAGGRPPARHAVAPAGSPAAHRRPWAVTAP
ncbi:MAG: GAF domain-containing protein, partial [Amnibacterium sp.]